MSVARVPDSRRLQSIFVIVEYIRLSCQLSYFTVTSLPRVCALTQTDAGIRTFILIQTARASARVFQ